MTIKKKQKKNEIQELNSNNKRLNTQDLDKGLKHKKTNIILKFILYMATQ